MYVMKLCAPTTVDFYQFFLKLAKANRVYESNEKRKVKM